MWQELLVASLFGTLSVCIDLRLGDCIGDSIGTLPTMNVTVIDLQWYSVATVPWQCLRYGGL